MKSPINSEKHYVQQSVATVALGARAIIEIAKGVVAPTAPAEVRVGAQVKAVFVEMWVTSDDTAQGSTVATLEKYSGGQPGVTYAQIINLQDYPNKKNILFTTQGLTPPNVQSGIPFIRQWFKIPKGKQRIGLGEVISLNIAGISNGANYCGMITYKEYY